MSHCWRIEYAHGLCRTSETRRACAPPSSTVLVDCEQFSCNCGSWFLFHEWIVVTVVETYWVLWHLLQHYVHIILTRTIGTLKSRYAFTSCTISYFFIKAIKLSKANKSSVPRQIICAPTNHPFADKLSVRWQISSLLTNKQFADK